MNCFHHLQGPRLKATFFTNSNAVTKITLAEHNQDGCCWQLETKCPLSDLINRWMTGYCEKGADLPHLPLLMEGLPPFTLKVLTALQTVPFGKTLSYQELAFLAGNGKAARAAGNACNRNPFPLVIPCHRILAANQKLGGFAFGTGLKRQLLSFESHSL